MAEIKLGWDLDPIERLNVEIENEKVESVKVVGKQLLKDFAEDERLRDCYKSKKIQLADIWKVIAKTAEKQNHSGNSVCIKDDDVYSWARQYILDGEIAAKSEKELVLNAKTREELIKEAAEEFKKMEIKKLADKKAAEEKEEEDRIKAEMEKNKKLEEVKLNKEKEKIEKIKEEGQISLW